MRVYELIELLEKCPDRGAFVMYDATEGIKNNALTVYDDMGEEQQEPHFSVDNVLVGSGTLRGYVYLTEEQEAR